MGRRVAKANASGHNAPHIPGPSVSPQDVIDEAKTVNFDDEKSWKEFQKKYQDHLEKNLEVRVEDGVLHIVAKEEKKFPNYREFTKWAIKHHKQLLKNKDHGGYPPLHLALSRSNHGFVSLVLEHAVDIRMLLEQYTVQALSCLHRAIWDRSPFTEAILDIVNGGQGDIDSIRNTPRADNGTSGSVDIFTIASTDASHEVEKDCIPGMTALHFAVTSELKDPKDDIEYDDCLSALEVQSRSADIQMVHPVHSGETKGVIDGISTQPPRAIISSIRRDSVPVNGSFYDKDTLPGALGSKLGRFDDSQGTGRMQPPPKREYDRADLSVGIKALEHLMHKPKPFDPLIITQKLIKAKPEALFLLDRDENPNTPFQARLKLLQGGGKGEDVEARRKTIDEDKILRFVREYVISGYDRREALKALYTVGREKVLEFNLHGLPHSHIDADFLNGLGKVLRFEGLLKYVAIPRLTVESSGDLDAFEPEANDQGNQTDVEQIGKAKGKGLTHMYSIFKWLETNHVDSILEVTVVDNVEPSHSDEVIEACMRRFNVRVWNWYKVDLCCQVILNAAKNVTDVTLYSSGSNAVLAGWSSSSGLPMLQKLKRVHINVQEGLERPKRLHAYMAAFENQLKKHKPEITFTWRPHKPGQDYDSVFANQGTDKVAKSEWMRSMKKFSSFLREVKSEPLVEPIKIAVIDDGINATSNAMEKIEVGESFAPLSRLTGRSGAYYVPSGPHGTLMAELIYEVCPVVKLYIAQLEVLPGQNGQRSFTPESATEAIKWATSQKVDIISMSWSIHSNTRAYGALEDALRGAVGANILLFCSSIDEGPTAPDNTYPGKERNCIKIGAATGKGAKLSWVSATKSDFFLPGEAIQTSSDIKAWGQAQTGIFGSSVATAIAAGLAGVFIYCDKLLADRDGDASGGNENKDFKDLKTPSNMKQAFEHLAKGSEDNKFVQPWSYLTVEDGKPLVWNEKFDRDSTEMTRQKLKEFIRYIKR